MKSKMSKSPLFHENKTLFIAFVLLALPLLVGYIIQPVLGTLFCPTEQSTIICVSLWYMGLGQVLLAPFFYLASFILSAYCLYKTFRNKGKKSYLALIVTIFSLSLFVTSGPFIMNMLWVQSQQKASLVDPIEKLEPVIDDQSPVSEWITYTNHELGYSIRHPPSWITIGNNEVEFSLTHPNLGGETILYISEVSPDFVQLLFQEETESMQSAEIAGYRGYARVSSDSASYEFFITGNNRTYDITTLRYDIPLVRDIVNTFKILDN